MSIRKIRNRNERERHLQNRQIASDRLHSTETRIKARIKTVYHPGDDNPKGFEYLNINIIRVVVESTDRDNNFQDEIVDWVFPLQVDPQLFSLINGSDNWVGKSCYIQFSFPNLRATGEVYLDSAASYNSKRVEDDKPNKSYLKQKFQNLTSALLG